MSPQPAPPGFDALYLWAAVAYGLYLVADLAAPKHWRAWPLAAGVALHAAGFATRARAISWFPLTNKFESFYAFSLFVGLVLLLIVKSPSRLHRLGVFLVGAVFYAFTLRFDRGTFYPPPLMMTIWYPMHVPASFLAYALWTSSAFAGLGGLRSGQDLGRTVLGHAFWGWMIFSLSMVFGGFWGYVAWGAWFLWDPKVVWSVVLWLFYSGFVHVRYWPDLARPRPLAVLSFLGFLIMLVAYVGTSFFFGHGSHAFG